MEHKVELLAPAGNYEAFIGAINAGADAVYLGGKKFGARAYADNFSTEEICRALRIAHFMGRKIYLTVNTLVKESEFDELYDYLLPFYEAGLDGVIVQDLGVFAYIREHFPELPLHASTQMTLTGARGAAFLKEQGVVRIVPARELSLEEVREIKERTGMEIECFIHGAMCYCYSGQCLFSSVLGGRSGNRGRCAQPCRLPYQIYEDGRPVSGEGYPLSLKDLCTLSLLPKLMEAGIDSFKIEGRMKKPEYTAGVTALYRKYMDRCEQYGAEGYQIEEEDFRRLRSLYIRSEIQTGYYERHNGKEMITLRKPGYGGSDEVVLNRIRASYLHEPDKMPVTMCADVKVGEPLGLRLAGEDIQVSVTGDIVEQARKLPMQEADIRKQLLKTGNSCVTISACTVAMEGEAFVPVGSLNQLRREAVAALEEERIRQHGLSAGRTQDVSVCRSRKENILDARPSMDNRNIRDCLVSTYDQLRVVTEAACRRVYVDSDLYIREHSRVAELLSRRAEYEYALALPYVIRARDEEYLRRLQENLKKDGGLIRGFLIRNLEELSYVMELPGNYAVIPDVGLYCMNGEAIRFFAQYCDEVYLPYEVNGKEASRLVEQAHGLHRIASMVVYGRIPMMVTANCLKKTSGRCRGGEEAGGGRGQSGLKDRYGRVFPVETHCEHCYNIIYNSVPYSLHLKSKEVRRIGADVLRYDFIMESAGDCRRIISGEAFPYQDYTTGHLKRGVE
ncbi:MAG: U32 family peptidase [Clostridiales bacterium]|nr:U32 family peptidase [Clostridiales bacterium]